MNHPQEPGSVVTETPKTDMARIQESPESSKSDPKPPEVKATVSEGVSTCLFFDFNLMVIFVCIHMNNTRLGFRIPIHACLVCYLKMYERQRKLLKSSTCQMKDHSNSLINFF